MSLPVLALLGACTEGPTEAPLELGSPHGAPVIQPSAGSSGACAPLPSGLVSWWSGDLDGRDVHGSNDGNMQNEIVAGSPALVGGGFTLDGVDDFVEVANSSSLNITGSLTLMAWVNVVSLGQYGASVINKGNVGNYDESYAMAVGADLSPVLLLNSGKYPGRPDLNRLILGGPPLTAGVWHLLSGTFDETSGEVNLYVDGQRQAFILHWTDGPEGVNHIFSTSQPLLIGKAERAGSSYPTTYFKGQIDEAQVYNQAVTQSEIQVIYEAGPLGFCGSTPPVPPPPPPPPPPGMVDLDTWGPSGSSTGPFVSSDVLARGVSYLVTVQGTHSFWSASSWVPGCALAEPLPLFLSPETLNGQVAADPEFRWTDNDCLDVDPPLHQTLHFQTSLDGGVSFAHLEPLNTGYNPAHAYVYRVNGTGNPIAFRFVDNRVDDNYGVFRIRWIPEPTAHSGGPYVGSEGSAVQFDGSASSDPVGEGLSYSWNFGDAAMGSGVAPTHVYADDGSYTVTLIVTDGNGTTATAATTATISNVAPVLTTLSAPADPQPVNTLITADATFSDVGTLDAHTVAFDWDAEGSSIATVGSVVEAGGSGTASASHSYSAPGVYTLQSAVTDDDGGIATTLFHYLVVYDASAGFVTGGGWIVSPPGALAAGPELTGKANFGFLSKYKKGTSTPTGTTEFQFKTGNLNFHSLEYEWLVVAGARAQYKGWGTINGVGDYRFLVTAIDGAQPGGGGVDKLRIKIWDTGTGGVIYDNQMGASDTADPNTAIQGGAIVIHK